MSDMNLCMFTGRLGADPETRYTTSGSAVTNFSLATNQSWKNKDGEKQEKTEWVKCVAFNKIAEIIAQYLLKGSFIRVSGRLQTRQYEDKGGDTRYITEIVVIDMQMLGGKQESGKQESKEEDNSDIPF